MALDFLFAPTAKFTWAFGANKKDTPVYKAGVDLIEATPIGLHRPQGGEIHCVQSLLWYAAGNKKSKGV